MSDRRQFCTELGIDESRAQEVLLREHRELTSTLTMPWYVRLVVGLGAWVTAIAVISLGAAIIMLIEAKQPMFLMIALGIANFVVGLLILRIDRKSVFMAQLGAAIAAAGVAMTTFGIVGEQSRAWPAFLAGLVMTATVVFTTSNRTLQFLVGLLTAILFVFTLIDSKVPYFLTVAALAGPAGMALILRPFERDLRPLAIVLLLVFPIFSWFYIFSAPAGLYAQTTEPGAWLAKSMNIALFLSLAAIHWKQTTAVGARTRLGIFAVVAVIVGLLLPPGGAAALTILMLAFVLGSRPLALLGTLLQASYIWRFYYDMEVTLLIKSQVLMAVGAALVIAWWLMTRRAAEGAGQ